MSAGMRSGVNCMREKLKLKISPRLRTIRVLPKPGHAFEQTMAAAHQRDEDLLDQLFMADDDARHLGAQLVEGAPRAVDALFDLLY